MARTRRIYQLTIRTRTLLCRHRSRAYGVHFPSWICRVATRLSTSQILVLNNSNHLVPVAMGPLHRHIHPRLTLRSIRMSSLRHSTPFWSLWRTARSPEKSRSPWICRPFPTHRWVVSASTRRDSACRAFRILNFLVSFETDGNAQSHKSFSFKTQHQPRRICERRTRFTSNISKRTSTRTGRHRSWRRLSLHPWAPRLWTLDDLFEGRGIRLLTKRTRDQLAETISRRRSSSPTRLPCWM